MEHSQVAVGGHYLQICNVDMNTLNKQLYLVHVCGLMSLFYVKI